MTTGQRYRGVGRGPKTLDGCSVDLYLRLPYGGEVELFQPRIALRLNEANHVNLILGDGARDRGALADQTRQSQSTQEAAGGLPPPAELLRAALETFRRPDRILEVE